MFADDDVNWWSTFWLVPCALVQIMWNNGLARRWYKAMCVCACDGAQNGKFVAIFYVLFDYLCSTARIPCVVLSIPKFEPVSRVFRPPFAWWDIKRICCFFVLLFLLFLFFSRLFSIRVSFLASFFPLSHSLATSIAMTCGFSSKAQQ